MRTILTLLVCFVAAQVGYATVAVKGYTRSNGTYVAPHTRSDPNSTKSDNWSTKGNVNPYTGKEGTKDVSDASSLASQSSIPAYTAQTGNALPPSVDLTAAAKLTEHDLLLLIYAKVLDLEARVSAIEKPTRVVANGDPSVAPKISATMPPKSQPQGVPTIQQWRRVKAYLTMNAVLEALGEPAKITNNGSGEVWSYPGGGWVSFFTTGVVYEFGGYSSAN